VYKAIKNHTYNVRKRGPGTPLYFEQIKLLSYFGIISGFFNVDSDKKQKLYAFDVLGFFIRKN